MASNRYARPKAVGGGTTTRHDGAMGLRWRLNSVYDARIGEVFIEIRSGGSRQPYRLVFVGSNGSMKASGGGESCPLSRVSMQ
jgi:hypothetical protein